MPTPTTNLTINLPNGKTAKVDIPASFLDLLLAAPPEDYAAIVERTVAAAAAEKKRLEHLEVAQRVSGFIEWMVNKKPRSLGIAGSPEPTAEVRRSVFGYFGECYPDLTFAQKQLHYDYIEVALLQRAALRRHAQAKLEEARRRVDEAPQYVPPADKLINDFLNRKPLTSGHPALS